MADSEDVHQWFTNFLIKSATHKKEELILKTNNQQMNYKNQLLENFKNVLLKTTFGLQT